MNEYLMTLVIMVVLLVVINVICFAALRKSVHRMPISATLSYVVLAGTCYYIDVVLYALQWSIVIYILCFIVVPVAVYYVMYRIGSLKKQAEGTSPEGKKAHSGAELKDEAQSAQAIKQSHPQVVNKPQMQVVNKPQKNQPQQNHPNRVSSGTKADTSLSAAVSSTATAPIPFQKADFDKVRSKDTSLGAHAAISEAKDEISEVSCEVSARPQPAPAVVAVARPRHTVADITLPSQVKPVQAQMEQEEPRVLEASEAQEKSQVLEVLEAEETASTPAVKPVQEEASVVQASSYDLAFEKATQFKEAGRFAVAAAMYGKLATTAPTDNEGIKALFEEIACYISAKDKTKAYEKAKYLKENYRLDAGKTTKLHIIVQLLERD